MKTVFILGLIMANLHLFSSFSTTPASPNRLSYSYLAPIDSATIKAYKSFGLHDKGIKKIKDYFVEQGVKEEHVDAVMENMVRIIQEINAEGLSFELNPHIRLYLTEELELTEDQIITVEATAKRIANLKKQSSKKGRKG